MNDIKKVLVTGGAGFIGSNLCSTLLNEELPFIVEEIIVIDNLSLGKKEFIQPFINSNKLEFYQEDLLNLNKVKQIMMEHKPDLVFHLAANSDIGYGAKYTDWDLKQGTIATYNVLEAMRNAKTQNIIFASSSAIYGEAKVMPTNEDYGPLHPISFYGASKLACEGLISSFVHNFDMNAWIYRFGNIVGHNGTHGVLVDFINKLRKNPTSLEILGDGKQAKPYLYVKDCVNGMIYGFLNSNEDINYFNLACDGATSVKTIADLTVKNLQLKNVKYKFTGGERGWKGDVAQVRLDPSKLNKLGWEATHSSNEAIDNAIKDLIKQI